MLRKNRGIERTGVGGGGGGIGVVFWGARGVCVLGVVGGGVPPLVAIGSRGEVTRIKVKYIGREKGNEGCLERKTE